MTHAPFTEYRENPIENNRQTLTYESSTKKETNEKATPKLSYRRPQPPRRERGCAVEFNNQTSLIAFVHRFKKGILSKTANYLLYSKCSTSEHCTPSPPIQTNHNDAHEQFSAQHKFCEQFQAASVPHRPAPAFTKHLRP